MVLSSSESLVWLLRDWQHVRFASAMTSFESPDIIIAANASEQPRQSVAYRGQDFIIKSTIDWEDNWPKNIFAWLLFKNAPIDQQRVALWAREDLFPQLLENTDLNFQNLE